MSDQPAGTGTAVLIPCLNEEQTVGDVVRAFRSELPGAVVYVYDNNSTDETAAVAAAAGAVVRHVSLPGKGNVVRRMFADVEADIYVLVDGDGTYDPSVVGEIVDLVQLGGEDFVTASRVPVGDAYRRGHVVGNRALNALVRLLFKRHVPDMLSGYKAMSRRFVKSLPAMSQRFEIETEIAVHALDLGAPIAEVCAAYGERATGSSSKLSTYRDGTVILRAIVRLLRQSRPLLFFFVLAVLLLAAALVLGVPIVVTFAHTHKVPRYPTAILVTGLVVLAAISLTAGLVLDTVARTRREAWILRYLEIPGPLASRPAAHVSPRATRLSLKESDTAAAPARRA